MMAVEWLAFVDRRQSKDDMAIQFRSSEPLRHKQFQDECLAAMKTHGVEVWMSGCGDYSVAGFVTNDHTVALTFSQDIASRMALGLETE